MARIYEKEDKANPDDRRIRIKDPREEVIDAVDLKANIRRNIAAIDEQIAALQANKASIEQELKDVTALVPNRTPEDKGI